MSSYPLYILKSKYLFYGIFQRILQFNLNNNLTCHIFDLISSHTMFDKLKSIKKTQNNIKFYDHAFILNFSQNSELKRKFNCTKHQLTIFFHPKSQHIQVNLLLF